MLRLGRGHRVHRHQGEERATPVLGDHAMEPVRRVGVVAADHRPGVKELPFALVEPHPRGQLVELEYHHMKIDRCSDCGGIWLDKGEMEMLEHVDQSNIRSFVRTMFGLKK